MAERLRRCYIRRSKPLRGGKFFVPVGRPIPLNVLGMRRISLRKDHIYFMFSETESGDEA